MTRHPAELLDQAPPSDIDAEKGVLGSVMIDPGRLDDVVLVVGADDFSPTNATIFTAMMGLHNEGKRVDEKLLANRLKKANALEDIGGLVYLLDLVQAAPIAANAVYYAKIVREKSMLRKLMYCGDEMAAEARRASAEPRDVLERAERRLSAILDDRGAGQTHDLNEVFAKAFASLQDRMERKSGGGQLTGYADLDEKLGGLHAGELSILAARPSMGKTALAINIAEYASCRECGTLFVSLEMSAEELGNRLLLSHSGVDSHLARNGLLSAADRRKMIEAAADMSKATLYIVDEPSIGMLEIARMARRIARKSGLGMIVIDYLQLIEPEDKRDVREQQVAQTARRLKALARELKVPVLCLSQLNRLADSSTNTKPRLSHLRESGAIEQDADVVLFIHRQEAFETDQQKVDAVRGQAEIYIAKNRNGPTGNINMVWRSHCMRFESAAAKYQKDAWEQR